MEAAVVNFDEIFNAYVLANEKKWAHNRSLTLGASETFVCIRKGFFEKRGHECGYEPDADYLSDWGATRRGDLIENHHVVPAITDHMPEGFIVLYAGDQQFTFVKGKSSATPDGLITGLPENCKLTIVAGGRTIEIPNIKSNCVCLEIKSIDPRSSLLEEKDKHNGQTQMQLGLFNECTEFKPKFSIVLYFDASFLSKMTAFVVEFDEDKYQHGKDRASAIWAVSNAEELVPEGVFTGDCEHCRWRSACGAATVNSIPTYEDTDDRVTPETVAAMADLVLTAMAAKAQVKEAEQKQAIADEAIKSFLMTKNVRNIKGDTWTVSWYGQNGKKSLDKEALEKDGIDLSKYQKEGTPFDVLRITPKLKREEKAKKTRKTKKEA